MPLTISIAHPYSHLLHKQTNDPSDKNSLIKVEFVKQEADKRGQMDAPLPLTTFSLSPNGNTLTEICLDLAQYYSPPPPAPLHIYTFVISDKFRLLILCFNFQNVYNLEFPFLHLCVSGYYVPVEEIGRMNNFTEE